MKVSLVFFSFIVSFLLAQSVHAATVTFDNSAGTGTWEGPSNWDTNTVPTAGDDVVINTTVAVTATSTIDFNTLQIGNGTLTASLTLTGNIGTGGSITIKNAGTLTQNNATQQTLTGTFTIESGGTLKSGNNTTAQSYIVNFSVATFDLQLGGTVTTDALGYDGNTGSGDGSGPGGGAGGFAGSGGSHSGEGGIYTTSVRASAYCDITDVDTMGSGGGGSSGSGGDGGAGGGLIILTASGTANLSGTLTADGAAGTATHGGGGAGGGIKITADTITGTPTSFTATGGAGNSSGGAGGGGCIQLVYTTASSLSASSIYSSSAMTASGSTTGDDSSPGIFYVKQVGFDGDMVLKSTALSASAATPVSSSLSINNLYLDYASSSFSGVTINTSITTGNGSVILVRSNSVFTLSGGINSIAKSGTGPTFNVFGTLNATGLGNFSSTTLLLASGGSWNNNSTITSNSDTSLTLRSGATIVNNFDSISSAGTFVLSQGTANITDLTISRGTMTMSNFTTSSALSLGNFVMTGGTLTHSANSSTHAHAINISASNITLSSTSTITADSLGFTGSTASSVDGNGPGGGAYGFAGGGGSHAGSGGVYSTSPFISGYCDFTDVGTMGSGGAAGQGGGDGGDGGGLIILNASGTATLLGTITADGAAGTATNGGGGAGGGIKIIADVVTGVPTSLTATGGAGDSSAGAGGGGCVQIGYTTSNSLSASTTYATSGITASGSTTGNDSSPGIFYIKQVGFDGDMVLKSTALSASAATIVSTSLSINNLYLGYASTTFAGITVNSSMTADNASAILIYSGKTFTLGNSITSVSNSGTGPTWTVQGTLTGNGLTSLVSSTLNISGTFNATSLSNLSGNTMTLSNGSTWNNASTVTTNGSTSLTLNSGSTVSNVFTSFTSVGTLNISKSTASFTDFNITGGTVTMSSFTTGTPLSVSGAFSMTGGTLTHTSNTSTQSHVVHVQANTISVGASASVTANGKGFSGGASSSGSGQGPGGGTGNGTAGGGGGYGGAGSTGTGGGAGGSAYCTVTNVENIGSGGGARTTGVGGAGGGLIILSATATTTISGTVSATGSNGSATSGAGGSGGGIKIRGRVVTGTPTSLTAIGGNGNTNGGGGGGGCVQIVYTASNSISSATLTKGTGGAGGGDGQFGTSVAGVTVSAISGNTTEAGVTAEFTVVLDSLPSGTVEIPISTSDSTEGTVSTSTLTFDVANWNTPRTVTVTGVNDDVDDGNIAYSISVGTVSSTDPSYTNIDPDDVSVTNTDNDTAGVTLTESGGTIDITEGGATDSYTVVLNSQPTANVVITVTSDAESTVSTSSITFQADNWNVARTVTVTAVDDADVEGAHFSTTTHSVSSGDLGYNGISVNDVVAAITDNDAAGDPAGVTVTESGGTTDVTEGGVTDSYTIVLDALPTNSVTIEITPDAQSTVSTSSIVFTTDNWNTPQTVTVTAVDDALAEGAHTSTLTHAATSADNDYNGILINDVVANVTDNDSAGFTVSVISGNTTEAGGTATFTVVLNSEPTGTVTTTVHSSDLTEGTINTSTLVFSTTDWNVARTVTVTGVNDDIDDGNIAYTIILDSATSTDNNYNDVNPNDVNVTNEDNDGVGVTITQSGGTTDITEGGATDSYTVVLTSQPTGDVSVSITPDADSTVSTSSITFQTDNWNIARTVTVTAVDDALNEGVHTSTITHTVTSTDGGYDGIAVGDVVANVTDDDSAGFTVSLISADTTEAGGTATFTVVLNSQPTGVVTTTVHSSDTTEGTITTSTLVFDTNDWNLARTVTVTGVDDSIDDGNVVYSIILDTATSTDNDYNNINPSDVSVTNTDNDTAAVTVTESGGNTDITEGGATDSYTLVLDSQPTGDVSISITPDAQSTVSTSSVVFNPENWNVARTVTITAVNDVIGEGDHTSTITHTVTSTDGGYDGIATNDVVADVTDNDSAGFTVSVISGNTTEAGGTATFTVVLNSQPTGTVTTTVHSSDTTEGTINTSTLVFSTDDWNVARTVTVTGINDDVDDGDIAYTIILDTATSTDNNYNNVNPNDVNVTNTDNDGVGFTVSAISGNTTEAGGTATFTIVLNSQPTGAVTTTVSSSDVSEGTVSTSTIVFNTDDWNIARTVTVTGVTDDIDDGNVNYTIVLGAAVSEDGGYNGINPNDVNVTNEDNDAVGITVTESGGNIDITEAGGTDTYTIVLDSEPTADVVITLTPDAQSTVSTSSVTFQADNWNVARTVTVTAVDDATVEGNHTSTITHTADSADGGYDAININDVVADVADNDIEPEPENDEVEEDEVGGGAGVVVTLPAPPTVPVAMPNSNDSTSAVQTIILGSNTAEKLTVGFPGHTVTKVSADEQYATIIIHSEPIELRLTKGVAQSADTDHDGKLDLQVVYNGTVQGNPKFTFTQLQEISTVVINGGKAQTYSPRVTLHFNVVNAEMVAISNTSDFSRTTFQPFTTNTVWTLPEESGEKTVFVRFRSKSGGIYDTSAQILLKDLNVTCPLPLFSAYKSPVSSAVYYITPPYSKEGQLLEGTCTKRPFRSSDIYFSYFDSWNKVQVVEQNVLSGILNDGLGFMPRGPRYEPQNGSLLKEVSDPRVFVLINGEKRPILSEEAFLALGYQWSWVEDVDPELLSKFPLGADLFDAIVETHPANIVIKYENSPKLYWLEKNSTGTVIKRLIPNEQVWKGLNFRQDRILTLPLSETYPDGVPLEAETGTLSVPVSGVFINTLQLGSTGDEVRLLQQKLKELGYYDADITGYFGPVTEEAVKALQTDYQLTVIGVVGPQTRELLNRL